MTYEINITKADELLWQIDVMVKDAESVVLTGQTFVACETAQEAQEYADKVFLPDLRRNYSRQIGGLVLSWEEVQQNASSE